MYIKTDFWSRGSALLDIWTTLATSKRKERAQSRLELQTGGVSCTLYAMPTMLQKLERLDIIALKFFGREHF